MFEPTTLLMIFGAAVSLTAIWGGVRPLGASDPFCI